MSSDLVDATLHGLCGLGELDARVHAEKLGDIIAADGTDGFAEADEYAHHVSEVILMLDVGVTDPVHVLRESSATEAVCGGIALREFLALLGRAVLVLDDRFDHAVLAKDPAISRGVGRGHGENGAGVEIGRAHV